MYTKGELTKLFPNNLQYGVYKQYLEKGYYNQKTHIASFEQPSDAIKYCKKQCKGMKIKFKCFVYDYIDQIAIHETIID
jgi:hypothetical protein